MTPLQSKINEIEARIYQLEVSDLYTNQEQNHRIEEAKRELSKYLAQINQIEVNQPEILS